VQTTSHIDTQTLHPLRDRGRTPKGARRAVERREKTVAGVLYDTPLETADFGVGDVVVACEQLAPTAVPEPRGMPRRIDDVGKQHGGQQPVG
jgi:hypothetical protein